MNNNYSQPEYYYPRWITSPLVQASQDHPIVVLSGARQVGKSTLLLNADPFCQWRWLSMDDYDVLRQARLHPETLWAGADHLVIDEVQKAPEILPAIKQAVDLHPGRYRFMLSGSANLLLMRQVSESLAGRAVYFILRPMALGEINLAAPPRMLLQALTADWPEEGSLGESPPDPALLILRGLMPALIQFNNPQACLRWWEGYVATYLERDLRQLSQIDSLVDFRRLMELVALRSAQLLNQSEIGRDAGLSQSTVHRYLNLLETTHLFTRLPVYTSNRTSRLVMTPKAFWSDPGLAAYLSGYYDLEDLQRGREFGALFESLVYHHLRLQADLLTPSARLYTWRKRSGGEVDFVVEHGRRLLAVEVKRTARPRFADTAGLQAFLEANPGAHGLLVHGGDEVRRLAQDILAVPWTIITG